MLTYAQYRNGRQWKNRAESEVRAAYETYVERQRTITSPMEVVEGSDDPRQAVKELLPVVLRSLRRALEIEANKNKIEPAVTSRLAEARAMVQAANTYMESGGKEGELQAIAERIVERLRNANISTLSPDAPFPEDEPEDEEEELFTDG